MVKREWLSKNLDAHHVVIDVRSLEESSRSHIRSAVSVQTGRMLAMGEKFQADSASYKNRTLPGLLDKKAPIILYGNGTKDRNVLAAYDELVGWKYKMVAVLDGGFGSWKEKGLPTEEGNPSTAVAYVKKPVEGSIPPAEFSKLLKNGGAAILDVRTKKEMAEGMLKKAIPMPLEELETHLGELPKDKRIVVHCVSGVRAEIAYSLLRNHGFNASFLNESIQINKDGSYRID